MSLNKIVAIRGAITVEKNSKEEIVAKSVRLLKEILERNSIDNGCSPVSLIISTTEDITAFYPAAAVRESGVLDCPLFSSLEPPIENSLKLCIRMMLTVAVENKSFFCRHVYLDGAKALRKDLADKID